MSDVSLEGFISRALWNNACEVECMLLLLGILENKTSLLKLIFIMKRHIVSLAALLKGYKSLLIYS